MDKAKLLLCVTGATQEVIVQQYKLSDVIDGWKGGGKKGLVGRVENMPCKASNGNEFTVGWVSTGVSRLLKLA